MTPLEVVGILLIALAVSALFFYGFKKKGPWNTFWSFILIVFLGVLFVDSYAEPVGPVWYGIAWLDLILVGIIFALLLAAATPPATPRYDDKRPAEETQPAANATAAAFGIFFWLLMVFFLIAIFLQILM